MGKSLERRLYDAWRGVNGLRLSWQDVQELVGRDDAVQTRITNALATDFGYEEPECAAAELFSSKGSIEEFKIALAENNT